MVNNCSCNIQKEVENTKEEPKYKKKRRTKIRGTQKTERKGKLCFKK